MWVCRYREKNNSTATGNDNLCTIDSHEAREVEVDEYKVKGGNPVKAARDKTKEGYYANMMGLHNSVIKEGMEERYLDRVENDFVVEEDSMKESSHEERKYCRKSMQLEIIKQGIGKGGYDQDSR